MTVVCAGQEDKPLVRTVRAGDGFLAQSSKWLHFGLGDCDRLARVLVRWPDGSQQELDEVVVTQGVADLLGEFVEHLEFEAASPATLSR